MSNAEEQDIPEKTGLNWQAIIVAAVALVVFVVLVLIFTGRIEGFLP